MQILKIWRVWLKIWACHAHLNFEFQMGVAGPIFEPNPSNFVRITDHWEILLELYMIKEITVLKSGHFKGKNGISPIFVHSIPTH